MIEPECVGEAIPHFTHETGFADSARTFARTSAEDTADRVGDWFYCDGRCTSFGTASLEIDNNFSVLTRDQRSR